ncbi:hypothetical protein KCTC52924_00187 [Arenibacter antarcticus]|uniref:DUF4256 domain-containing protein n=1 Tax=Arenibacter antarcticus TaxID=2040469 RepID=A0ABW5VJ80_9FLAO|nr:DUF4256 domain-containing protein [Arenibacter sp. H213]MCM4169048.1 DUF4256 domain-containing protein [Arenibacter sp. H213]
MEYKPVLSQEQAQELISTLKVRFHKNMDRHKDLGWGPIQVKLEADSEKLWSLNEMESTGGEPDVVDPTVVGDIEISEEYLFYDCAAESPKGRRSACYDREGQESRKEHKPKNNAIDMATIMGVEILTVEQYKGLQRLGVFDAKTSSWVKTPPEIRKLGGALFADFRYGTVFVYHNSAPSYYAARGFRASIRL